MSDNPLDGIPAYNRVSIRAVLVHEGEDPSAALAELGIVNAIAVPVVLGEQPDLPGGILGDGRTPNLIAVLETQHEEDFVSSHDNQSDKTESPPGAARPVRPATTILPVAFGMRPLAPVRRSGDTGADAQSGRFGYRDGGYPPNPVCPCRPIPSTLPEGGALMAPLEMTPSTL